MSNTSLFSTIIDHDGEILIMNRIAWVATSCGVHPRRIYWADGSGGARRAGTGDWKKCLWGERRRRSWRRDWASGWRRRRERRPRRATPPSSPPDRPSRKSRPNAADTCRIRFSVDRLPLMMPTAAPKSRSGHGRAGEPGERTPPGSRLNVSWTISARPSNFLRISVWPVTSHTRAPLEIEFIAARAP